MQNMKELSDKFNDEAARIDNILFIAGMLGDGFSMQDALREFLEDEDVEVLESCFGPLPDHVKASIEDVDALTIADWLIETGKLGFLVNIATPAMEPTGEGSSSFSWAFYVSQWVYGDTIEAALEAGFAWVEKQRTKEKERSGHS
jgi:hypothetical protein